MIEFRKGQLIRTKTRGFNNLRLKDFGIGVITECSFKKNCWRYEVYFPLATVKHWYYHKEIKLVQEV